MTIVFRIPRFDCSFANHVCEILLQNHKNHVVSIGFVNYILANWNKSTEIEKLHRK